MFAFMICKVFALVTNAHHAFCNEAASEIEIEMSKVHPVQRFRLINWPRGRLCSISSSFPDRSESLNN